MNSYAGDIIIRSGNAASPFGGRISLSAGTSLSTHGSPILLRAGDTSAVSSRGGLVSISGGDGKNTDSGNGGSGGDIKITGGGAFGLSTVNAGGNVVITGGPSDVGRGGALTLFSGVSLKGSR
jgi:hypothetical protein